VPSFIKISPLSKKKSRHAKYELTDDRTDGQPQNMMLLLAAEA